MSFSRTRLASVLYFSAATLALAPLGSASTYKVDPVHSFALFSVHHFNAGYVWGRFNDPQGALTIDEDAAKDAFDVTLKVASLDTHNEKRDGDLKGADWFDARQYPDMTFKSTSAKKAGDNKLEVTGDLTIHGVTKSVVVPIDLTGEGKDPWGNTRGGIQAEFTIKRADFGMKAMEGAVGDEVRLIVALEGVKK